ncbi:YbaK/EbsC family protein [Streptomyces sp. DSM 116496]|uniref:YbaK/EbsC family protein n=1 Tax=Streptomyces stoeckheimensis TaxID=3344656 RepID=UPI0038B3F735
MRTPIGRFDNALPAPDCLAELTPPVARAVDGWTARKVSFAPMETTVELTGMEYGGITPLGLPEDRPLLVDAAVRDMPYVVIGSGRRRGKLIAPGKLFTEIPGAELIEGLAL